MIELEDLLASDASREVVEGLAARIRELCLGWRSAEAPMFPNPALVARAPRILTLAESLGADDVHVILRAVEQGVGPAVGTIERIESVTIETIDTLLGRTVGWQREGRFLQQRLEADAAIALSGILGRLDMQAKANLQRGRAFQRMRLFQEAADAFSRAEQDATASHSDAPLRAVIASQQGSLASENGDFDLAIQQFDKALKLEQIDSAARALRINKADALANAGQLRSAAEAYEDVVDFNDEHSDSYAVAVSHDQLAQVLIELGEVETARGHLERAAELFSTNDHRSHAINSLLRARAESADSNSQSAAAAFAAAFDHAMADAVGSVDVDHYQSGFMASLEFRLQPGDPAFQLFETAQTAGSREKTKVDDFVRAEQLARDAGDLALALRAKANRAGFLGESPQFSDAPAIAEQVRAEAAALGLAGPERLALGILGSLADRGIDSPYTRSPLGPLWFYARALTLWSLQRAQVTQTPGVPDFVSDLEAGDNGMLDFQVGLLAEGYGAHEIAAYFFELAVEIAANQGELGRQVNRLGALLGSLHRLDEVERSSEAANQLKRLVRDPSLDHHGRLVGYRALGIWAEKSDPRAAIAWLTAAVDEHRALLRQLPHDSPGSAVSAQYPRLQSHLAALLRRESRLAEAYAHLLASKRRRLADSIRRIASVKGDEISTVEDVQSALGSIDQCGPSLIVDLLYEGDAISAFLVGRDGRFAVESTPVDASRFASLERGDLADREAAAIALCTEDTDLRALFTAIESHLGDEDRVLILPDGPLFNLPLHIVPAPSLPWCEFRPIGFLPTVEMLGLRHPGPPFHKVLVAGDSRGDLPFARQECLEVAAAWQSRVMGQGALLGADCSLENLSANLEANDFAIIHLAIHGRGDASSPGRASLWLAEPGDTTGRWCDFGELTRLDWKADLVVFSGCSTAVAGNLPENALGSVVFAAAEAGASRVVGSLWPVNDEVAMVMMTAFQNALSAASDGGPVDLRLILDTAREACREWLRETRPRHSPRRNGFVVNDPQRDANPDEWRASWAPFVVIGDPILRIAPEPANR